ncbi:hypothetical protein V6N11_055327 [Hibiscus sabdariffa]|uniref:Uncharacterized protein n=1 Tax=Hibiscus sabdariffa TaxID=183260 RepID=A0ABR2PF07_9ROSI
MGETYILGSLPNNVSKDDHMAWGNFNVIENIEEGSGIAGKTKKPSWVELVSNRLVENSDNNNIDIDLLIEVGKQELDRAWYDALNMRLLASNKDQDMMDVRGIPTRNDSSKKSLSWAAIVDERNKISMKSDSGKAKEATSMVETPSDVDEPKDFFPEMHIMTRNGEIELKEGIVSCRGVLQNVNGMIGEVFSRPIMSVGAEFVEWKQSSWLWKFSFRQDGWTKLVLW